jgi:hypothetical protein
MRPNRTVRRPTRWTPEEWRRVEDAAESRSIPPARFVREAVLCACDGGTAETDSPVPRRARDELVHQLGRVLNNLRQLERSAAGADAGRVREAAAFLAPVVVQAIRRAPARERAAAPLVEELIEAGRALNEIVRRIHAQEELPTFASIYEAVSAVYRFVKGRLP